jgi:hypothetical protein
MSSQEFEGPGAEGPERDRFDRPDAEVAGYAAEVRALFADLSDAESAELLEDLEDHLSEVAAEDAGTLRERLGAPAAYARELRQAAGLPEPGEGSGSGGLGGGAGPKTRRTLRSRLRSKAQQTWADAERRARGHRAGREVLDFLPSLRPAWWVLRAWVAVRLLEVITTSVDPWHEFSLIPRVGDSTLTGLLALLVAVPASVYVARDTVPDGWRRRAVGAGEGILVLFTVAMVLSGLGDDQHGSGDTAGQVSYVQQGPQGGLTEDGQQVSNLYVYDQSGKLLNGVLVYDQDGRPVSATPYSLYAGGNVIDNDGWLDGNGNLVTNIYPQRVLTPQWSQPDRGTHFVAMPPPSVNLPQGLHHAPLPGDPQQSSSPSPTTNPTTSSTTSPTTSPNSSPTTPATTASDGAHTSTALPSTPPPPDATH